MNQSACSAVGRPRGPRQGAAVILMGIWVAVGLPSLPWLVEVSAARPNILLIIADDYGADSHPFYNSDPAATFPPTPSLNRLFTTGVMFRNCYAYPTCSPTRSALLTGRYGFRTGIGYALETTNDACLTAYELTIPELLQSSGSGYACAMFGKWHTTLNTPDPNTIGGFPLFVGMIHGAFIPPTEGYFSWPLVSNNISSTCTNYATTEVTDQAAQWIAAQSPQSNWFCWVAYNAGHTPYHKPPDALCPTYAGLSGNALDIATHPRPYYEASIEALDTEIGRLLTNVDLSTTLVLFLGDNGTLGSSPVTSQPIIQPPYSTDRGKGTLYEGGVRVPFFAAGAGVSNLMRVCTQLVSVVDFFATVMEVAGVDTSPYFGEARPLDSVSFAAALRETNAAPARTWVLSENFSSHTESNRVGRSVLDSRYKYLEFQDGTRGYYDLAEDPLELTNLYHHAFSPERSNHLAALQGNLTELQNFPVFTQPASPTGGTAVAFINDVSFQLWSATNLTATDDWTEIAGTTITTNGDEVWFTLPPDDTATRAYRATAPAR